MYLTISLIILYLVITKIITYFAHKSSKHTIDDYFLSSRSLGSLILVATVFSTVVNALVVTGVPAQIYEGGILYLFMYVVAAALVLFMYFFGNKIRESGVANSFVTPAELLSHKYNSYLLQALIAIVCILSAFPFLAIQFSAIGKVFSIATGGGVSYEASVIIVAVSIGVYLIWGGVRAVVLTDVFQGAIFAIILIMSAVLFTYWTGSYGEGVSKLYEVIPEKMSFNSNNTYVFIDRILSWPFAFFLWPQIFQRMLMAKDEQTIKKSSRCMIVILIGVLICSMTMGIMSTASLYNSGVDKDQFVAEMYNRFWPAGASLVALVVFATGMSTIDSILLSISSIVSRDFIKVFRKKDINEEGRFNSARIISLVILLVTVCFALSPVGRGAIAPLVTLGASFATLLLWPLLATFCFKEVGKFFVSLSIIVSGVLVVLIHFKLLILNVPFGSATIGFVSGLSVFLLGIVVSIFSSKKA